MTTPPRLVSLSISPWSERARWALDHHGLAYELIPHEPFLGERRLRRLAGDPDRRVTAPLLLAGEEVLADSWDIASYADRLGSGSKLIPPEREAEVRRWYDAAEEASSAGRALVVAAMLRSPAALDEGAPPAVPRWLRPALRPVVRFGMGWFGRKYGIQEAELPERERQVRAGLDALRAGLAAGGGYLLGSFSYADVLMATFLQGIRPFDGPYVPMGPATRRAWTQEPLAAEYADLLAWRDALYREHRRGRSGSS